MDTIRNLNLEQNWIESLLDISTNASRIHGSATLPFIVTNGRMLFVTQHPITYSRNNDQVKEAEDLLIRLKKRDQLDLPLEMTMTADDVE